MWLPPVNATSPSQGSTLSRAPRSQGLHILKGSTLSKGLLTQSQGLHSSLKGYSSLSKGYIHSLKGYSPSQGLHSFKGYTLSQRLHTLQGLHRLSQGLHSLSRATLSQGLHSQGLHSLKGYTLLRATPHTLKSWGHYTLNTLLNASSMLPSLSSPLKGTVGQAVGPSSMTHCLPRYIFVCRITTFYILIYCIP